MLRLYLKSYLHVLGVGTFLSGGLVVIFLSYAIGFGQYGMGFAFFLAPIIYIVLHRTNRVTDLTISRRPYQLASIAYFLLLASAVLVYLDEPYIRSRVYFGLSALTFVVIIFDILYIDDSKLLSIIALTKIVLASIAFRAGRFFVMETIPGNDTQFHIRLSTIISQSGHVPDFTAFSSKYVYSPLWHIGIAMGELITGSGMAVKLFLFAAVPFAIVTIVGTYAIAARVTGDLQVGLFTALFASVADILLVRGTTGIYTSSFVVCFFVVLLLIALHPRARSLKIGALITFLLTVTLLTHQLSSFAVFLITCSFALGDWVYRHMDVHIDLNGSNISAITVCIFGAATYLHWNITSNTPDTTFFENVVLLSTYAFRGVSEGGGTDYTEALAEHSVWSNILYNLGYSFLLFFAVLGILLWLRSDNLTPRRFALISATGVLFVIIYPLTLAGFDQVLLPHRQLVYLELLLVIFAGVATKRLFTFHASSIYRIVVVLVLLSTVFALITTPYVNRNNPVYSEDRVDRTGMTQSEVDSMLWAYEHGREDTPVTTDPYFSNRKSVTELYRAGLIEHSYLGRIEAPHARIGYYNSLSQSGQSQYVVYREYVSNKEFIVLTGTFGDSHVIGTDRIERTLQNESVIYSNGSGEVQIVE